MRELAPGARKLPTQHISIRVPWHDRAWDGSICADPKANSSCSILPRIAEEKDDEAETLNHAKFWNEIPEAHLPGCRAERGAFMAPFEFTRHHDHPYEKSSPPHQHFASTAFTQPPYSANCIPFAWMAKDRAVEKCDALQLGFEEASEIEVHKEMGFKTNWVQVKKNQLVLLDTFFGALTPEESLCFFYAKDTPLANDPRRVIVGVGRVKSVGQWVEYKYSRAGSHQAIVWDRIVQHSIRPEFVDGFLFPYQEILARAADDPSIDTSAYLAFAPEECWSEFSYASEHVSHDSAVASLLVCVETLRRMGEVATGDWKRQIDWIDAELNRLWKLRGPFPGLGSALKAFGFSHGNLIAYDLGRAQTEASAEWTEDPWILVDRIVDDPSLLSPSVARNIGNSEREAFRALRPGRRALLRLLSRFSITENQATRYYQETERQKAGIVLSDEEIVANPYLLYELDRSQKDPIAVGTIDRGLYPDDIVGIRYPVPAPSAADGPLDARRVRALLVSQLEASAVEGHTLQPRDPLLQKIRDLEIRPTCPVSLDLMTVIEGKFEPEIRLAEMADRSVAYQLNRLRSVGAVIRSDIQKRRRGVRHIASLNWRGLVDSAFNAPADSAEEDLARVEKAAALEQIYCSRLSVLLGPAGTGKTTLLKVLCEQPDIQRGGVLLLAPTGKARVRMETQIGVSGAKTIAQFLVPLKRYLPEVSRYVLSDAPKHDGAQTVIIDEASMLTEEQLAAVIDGLQPPSRLILVGDSRQLPPIGSGRPFVDIVRQLAPEAGTQGFPIMAPGYAELTIRRRQVGESRPDLILAEWFSGRPVGPGGDSVWSDLESGAESPFLRVVRWDSEQELEQILFRELKSELALSSEDDEDKFEQSLGGKPFGQAVYFNFRPSESIAVNAENWQVLSPVRAGGAGVERLNRAIQSRFRKRALSWATPAVYYHRKTPKPMGRHGILYGDKVISITNGARRDYWPEENALGYVANGEIGMVVGQYKSQNSKFKGLPKKLEVEYSSQAGFKYGYWPSDFRDEGDQPLELAYALTIHKSQGSEFETVILVVPNPCRLLSPELLYTALTRQKKRIVLLHQGPLLELKNYSRGHLSETARRMTNLFEAPSPVEVESKFLEDRLIHRTRRGEAVRSKSEVVIADLLYSLKVDYSYEKEFVAPDGSKRLPDFTIDDPASGLKVYWEHLGMLDRQSYRDRWEQKQNWYKSHGILPLVDGGGPQGTLVTSRDDERGGIDSGEIERLARTAFGVES